MNECGPKLMEPVKHERTRPFLRYGEFVFPDNEQTNELLNAMITARLTEIRLPYGVNSWVDEWTGDDDD